MLYILYNNYSAQIASFIEEERADIEMKQDDNHNNNNNRNNTNQSIESTQPQILPETEESKNKENNDETQNENETENNEEEDVDMDIMNRNKSSKTPSIMEHLSLIAEGDNELFSAPPKVTKRLFCDKTIYNKLFGSDPNQDDCINDVSDENDGFDYKGTRSQTESDFFVKCQAFNPLFPDNYWIVSRLDRFGKLQWFITLRKNMQNINAFASGLLNKYRLKNELWKTINADACEEADQIIKKLQDKMWKKDKKYRVLKNKRVKKALEEMDNEFDDYFAYRMTCDKGRDINAAFCDGKTRGIKILNCFMHGLSNYLAEMIQYYRDAIPLFKQWEEYCETVLKHVPSTQYKYVMDPTLKSSHTNRFATEYLAMRTVFFNNDVLPQAIQNNAQLRNHEAVTSYNNNASHIKFIAQASIKFTEVCSMYTYVYYILIYII